MLINNTLGSLSLKNIDSKCTRGFAICTTWMLYTRTSACIFFILFSIISPKVLIRFIKRTSLTIKRFFSWWSLLFILVSLMFDAGVKMLGEIRCLSLLEVWVLITPTLQMEARCSRGLRAAITTTVLLQNATECNKCCRNAYNKQDRNQIPANTINHISS